MSSIEFAVKYVNEPYTALHNSTVRIPIEDFVYVVSSDCVVIPDDNTQPMCFDVEFTKGLNSKYPELRANAERRLAVVQEQLPMVNFHSGGVQFFWSTYGKTHEEVTRFAALLLGHGLTVYHAGFFDFLPNEVRNKLVTQD